MTGRTRPPSSGRTATPPATAWCRCRSRCRWRTASSPRAPRSSWRRRWAWTRRWSCTPRRWARTSRFFVVYGRVQHLVDTSKVTVVERDYPLLSPKEANLAIRKGLRRRLTVVGGCIGTDAHTVGIDAILNIKGFAGEKGLEYYREIRVVNLGAQVSVPQLVASGPRGARRRRAGLAGRHPARRARAQHPGDVGGVPRGLPGRPAAGAGRRRSALRRGDGRRARRRPGLRPRHHTGRGGELPGARAGDPSSGRAA